MSAKFPAPGEVFEDTYRIETILGSGGFARVYRAVETGLERPVALKILRPPINTSQSDSQRDTYLETLMERFQREAMMLSRLRSSFTVNLYKYGKTPDGLLYMALEYIDGLSLAEILRAGKPIDPSRVVKILTQVLSSLQEAHSLGMLHRDLKPANIMVYEHLGVADQVKLLDFGIAKLVQDTPHPDQRDLTSDGTLIGTPRYMAPEQIQGDDVGPASDIYALGLVAYELLTGERAIKGDSSIQIIGKQLAPQSFRLPLESHIPGEVRQVVNRMIEKELVNRFASCEEVIEALASPSILADEASDVTELDISALVQEIDDTQPTPPPPAGEERREIPLGTTASFDDPTPTSFEMPAPVKSGPSPLVIGVLIGGLLLVAVVTAMVAFDGDDAQARDKEAAVKEAVEPPPPVETPPEVETVPTVRVMAKLDGDDLEGATVLVNGVEKGVTPLTLDAPEVQGTVSVRYTLADRDTPLEQTQEVSSPRDVLFEFNPVVAVTPAEIVEPKKTDAKEKSPTTIQPKEKTAERPPRQKRPPAQDSKTRKNNKKNSIYHNLIPD